MTPKLYIRVSLGEDGKTPVRLLVYDGVVVGPLSYVDVVEFLTQAPSTLRWEVNR